MKLSFSASLPALRACPGHLAACLVAFSPSKGPRQRNHSAVQTWSPHKSSQIGIFISWRRRPSFSTGAPHGAGIVSRLFSRHSEAFCGPSGFLVSCIICPSCKVLLSQPLLTPLLGKLLFCSQLQLLPLLCITQEMEPRAGRSWLYQAGALAASLPVLAC